MVNESKKHDPRMWRKWRQSGAIYQSPEQLAQQRERKLSSERQRVLLAALRAKWRPPPPPPPPLTNAQKQSIISEYLKTPQGRTQLAASMTQPLRTRRDYASIGRKLIGIQPMPPGALDVYDREPNPDLEVINTIKGMVDMLQDPCRL